MTTPLITIYNADTQEKVSREMNKEEFAQYEIDLAAIEAETAARNAE